MAIYIKLGDVTGNVTEKEWAGWVNLDSCSFASHRHVEMTTGATADRSRNHPQLTPISISKPSDNATEALMRHAIVKSEGVDAEIVFVVPTGDNKVEATQKMKLTDVIVAGYNQSASKEGDVYESLELTNSKIDVEVISRDTSGKGPTPKHVIYDVKTGVGS